MVEVAAVAVAIVATVAAVLVAAEAVVPLRQYP